MLKQWLSQHLSILCQTAAQSVSQKRKKSCNSLKAFSKTELLEHRTLFQVSPISTYSVITEVVYGPLQQQLTTSSVQRTTSDTTNQAITAASNSLTINNQSLTFATLLDTDVTMTGRSELHITGTSSPITSSIINLNSSDSWFFLDNIKPSVVNSTYLSQVKVNGTAAVHGTNVRVVQYGMGTVVIPHAPSYLPMQVFTGANFTGTARSISQYTIYNTSGELVEQFNAASSFKLKRGYMATFATQTNGTGASKVYIAQDHDLDVSLLPSDFNNKIQFIRVLPWRWVSKKGASDLSPATLNAQWFYNWNNDTSLTTNLDAEYVPIRQQLYWPGLPGESQTNVTHVLGFNEPNNPAEDAYTTLGNGSIEAALDYWPAMMATGLRIGAPAVTDGGKSWLYSFMDQAIARGLRVDYIPIHMYQAGHTATSLYNWLKDVYDRYHLPVWITEFNNGANWTGGTDPTYEQNATAIGSFIDMFDNTPWIERYAVYSRVEAVRQMTYDEGGLTPAGQVYYDNTSPINYVQEPVPDSNTGTRNITRLPLDGNLFDASGYGNNGEAIGGISYTTGQIGQSLQFDGATSAVRLPENIAASNSFTFAGWINWDGGADSQRIFDFGSSTTQFMYLTPSVGGQMRFGIKNGSAATVNLSTSALPSGSWQHVAVTMSGTTARIYLNGTQVATGTIGTTAFTTSTNNHLGKSQFSADAMFAGKMDDVLFTDTALSATQIAALMTNTPPQFSASSLTRGPALRGLNFSGTISGTASDVDAGDSVSYGKAYGPSWLTVASDGSLSGTPTFADSGVQEFVVSATDSRGATTYAILIVEIGETYWRGDVNNFWNTNSSGNTNWSSNSTGTTDTGSLPNASSDIVFAASNAANLPSTVLGANTSISSLRIATSTGVTIGGSHSLTIGSNGFFVESGAGATTINTSGQLILGGSQSWNISSSNLVTVASVISGGAAGLTKTGSGTLALTGNNIFTGTTTIDAGLLRLGNGTGAGNLAGNIINNADIDVNRTNNQTLAGAISGTGNLAKNGVGTLTLSGANSYSGTTTIGNGVILATSSGALGTGTLSIGPGGNATTSRLDLSGGITLANAVSLPFRNSGTVAVQNISGNNRLSGTITLDVGGSAAIFQSNAGLLTLGAITSIATGSRVPTLTGSGNGLINGVISDGSGVVGIVKSGTGTWTLSAVNSFTGTSTVNSGTLALGGSERIANASGLALGGGTFATGGYSETLGAITLSANSSINFGSGAGTLSFSGIGTFTAGTTLNITNWTSGADRLFIGTTASLTAAQLAQIKFSGTSAQQLSTGEIVPLTSAAPTLSVAANASPTTVTGTTVALSVLGADDGGESNLTYTWSVTSKPAGAVDPTFSATGTNAAKNSTATFTKAGNYTFLVTILDGSGLTVTSSRSVVVNQTFSGISAASTTIAAGSSITINGSDQFGDSMALGGGVSWSSNAGSITQSGIFTAPVSGTTSVTINASVGANNYSTNVSITAGRAWYKADTSGSLLIDSSGSSAHGTLSGAYSYVTGKSGNALSLTGGVADLPDGIVSGLNDFTFSSWVYLTSNSSWSRIFDFGSSTTNNMFLTANAGGNNSLRFAITTSGNGGEQRIDGTSLSLNTWHHVAVTLVGDVGTLYVNGVAVGTNSNMTLRPGSLGNTTNNYLGDSQYSADPSLAGRLDDVRILGSGLNASGVVALRDAWQAPTVASAAVANPSPVSGIAASLNVLGASAAGEAGLTYTWSVTGTPPGSVSFSANGTNAAKNITASFSQPGTYNMLVTIANSLGQSITSAVAYTLAVSGSISGQIFEDRNSNGSIDSGEPMLNGITVYLDANSNNNFDPGESSTITNGAGDYLFSNLAAGNYAVKQVLPSGYLSLSSPAVVNINSNTPQSGQNFANFPTTFTGTSGNDNFAIRVNGLNYDLWQNGVQTHTIAQSQIASISFDGNVGADTLLIEGSGAADPISISTAGMIARGSTIINYSNIGGLILQSGSYSVAADLGGIGLQIGDSSVTLTTTQNLASLTIDNGAAVTSASTDTANPAIIAGDVVINNATLSISPNGGLSGVSKFSSIAITGNGKLDLHDNDLVIDYGTGSTPYSQILNLIQSGLTLLGGNGSGIGSSEVDNQTLGGTVMAIVDNGAIGGEFTSLGAMTVPANSILIKYTWFGDANLNGAVDGDDYALVDTGFTSGGSLTGWLFGDMNFDSAVTGDDYALVDTGFIAQDRIL